VASPSYYDKLASKKKLGHPFYGRIGEVAVQNQGNGSQPPLWTDKARDRECFG